MLIATGTDVPANATSGYAKGCLFIDRNVATGTTGLYENIGTNTSCNFNAIGAVAAGEITLATGSILLGTAGVAAALDGKGDGKILIGNGTTMASFALSQDATMTNGGVVTIAKINNLATAAEVNGVCDGCTATAAEINTQCDLSLQTETITSGAISVTKRVTKLDTTAGATLFTLAAPDATMLGQVKVIEMSADNGDATLSLANVQNGSAGTTCTWTDVGDCLVLVGGVSKWNVVSEGTAALT